MKFGGNIMQSHHGRHGVYIVMVGGAAVEWRKLKRRLVCAGQQRERPRIYDFSLA